MTLKQRLLTAVRVVLKYTLNPLTRRLARTPYGPFALIRHVGRRSGKPYETPIVIARAGDDIVVELTYGPEVDWYKNVLAAGGCTVISHGKVYMVNGFEPMDFEAGRAAFPMPARLILRAAGMKHFVRFVVAQ